MSSDASFREGFEAGRIDARLGTLELHAKTVDAAIQLVGEGLHELVLVVGEMRATQRLIWRLVGLFVAPIIVALTVFLLTR